MCNLAIVTGASSGIGREIALLAAADRYDRIAAADDPLVDASAGLRASGGEVQAVEADLSTPTGVEKLVLASGVLSEATTAEMHRKLAEPGTAKDA